MWTQDSIEWFIEAMLSRLIWLLAHTLPPPPPVKLDRRLTGRLRRETTCWRGGGARSRIRRPEEGLVLYCILHSIISVCSASFNFVKKEPHDFFPKFVLLHNCGFCNKCTPKQCLHISVAFPNKCTIIIHPFHTTATWKVYFYENYITLSLWEKNKLVEILY